MSKLDYIQCAIREMLVIGVILGVVLFLVGRNVSDAGGVFACAATGFLFSPLVWAAYRVIRFAILPRRKKEAGPC